VIKEDDRPPYILLPFVTGFYVGAGFLMSPFPYCRPPRLFCGPAFQTECLSYVLFPIPLHLFSAVPEFYHIKNPLGGHHLPPP